MTMTTARKTRHTRRVRTGVIVPTRHVVALGVYRTGFYTTVKFGHAAIGAKEAILAPYGEPTMVVDPRA